MPKAKWIITGGDSKNPAKSGPVGVSTKADLKKRLKAAKKAGVKVNVREAT
jgi:hypothetical protein